MVQSAALPRAPRSRWSGGTRKYAPATRWWTGSRSGWGGLILVTGEARIGKAWLMEIRAAPSTVTTSASPESATSCSSRARRSPKHILYCTGVWDRPTIERQRKEWDG